MQLLLATAETGAYHSNISTSSGTNPCVAAPLSSSLFSLSLNRSLLRALSCFLSPASPSSLSQKFNDHDWLYREWDKKYTSAYFQSLILFVYEQFAAPQMIHHTHFSRASVKANMPSALTLKSLQRFSSLLLVVLGILDVFRLNCILHWFFFKFLPHFRPLPLFSTQLMQWQKQS